MKQPFENINVMQYEEATNEEDEGVEGKEVVTALTLPPPPPSDILEEASSILLMTALMVFIFHMSLLNFKIRKLSSEDGSMHFRVYLIMCTTNISNTTAGRKEAVVDLHKYIYMYVLQIITNEF